MKTIQINPNTIMRWVQWDHPFRPEPITTYAGHYERFKHYIHPGDYVVDIGAFTGDMTLPFGLLAGKSGKVIAFEPNPNTFRVLAANAALNSDSTNIECHNVAIMPESGDYTFHYSDPNFCNGGYAEGLKAGESAKSGLPSPLTVRGEQLDRFLDVDREIDFLKIDTEGFDHHILRSISDIIKLHRPMIMAEVFPGLIPAERKEYQAVVESLGYVIEEAQGATKPCERHFCEGLRDLIMFPL